MEKPEFWNAKQAAEYLGISQDCIHIMARSDMIPHIKIGRRIRRWTKEILDAYIAAQTRMGRDWTSKTFSNS